MKVRESVLLTLAYELNEAWFAYGGFNESPESKRLERAIDRLENFLGHPLDLEAEIPEGSIK